MSAKKMLNPDQFRMVPDSDFDTHSVDAYHPGFAGGQVPVATMIWDRGSGEVTNINVDENHRRQGIATRMWNTVHSGKLDLEPTPKHSTVLTDDGKKWSKAVGGESRLFIDAYTRRDC